MYLDACGEYAEAVAARMVDPMIDPGLPPGLLKFADTLAAINDTQPPVKKYTVHSLQERVYIDLPEGCASLILMDREEMMENLNALQDTGALCVEMKYVNCDTGDGIRTDIVLPFAGEETRYSFLPASRMEWFYRYFERVTKLVKNPEESSAVSRLEAESAKYVICIANGTAADLGE